MAQLLHLRAGVHRLHPGWHRRHPLDVGGRSEGLRGGLEGGGTDPVGDAEPRGGPEAGGNRGVTPWNVGGLTPPEQFMIQV